MRVPNPSPVLDKNCAPMGPEILSSTGAAVWRKAPKAFPHSSSVLDKFQSAILGSIGKWLKVALRSDLNTYLSDPGVISATFSRWSRFW